MRGRGVHGRGDVHGGGGGHACHILRDTVNEQAVRILLECILISFFFLVTSLDARLSIILISESGCDQEILLFSLIIRLIISFKYKRR